MTTEEQLSELCYAVSKALQKGWCKGSYAVDKSGADVAGPPYKKAKAFCLEGAIEHACYDRCSFFIQEALTNRIQEKVDDLMGKGNSIANWNDQCDNVVEAMIPLEQVMLELEGIDTGMDY